MVELVSLEGVYLTETSLDAGSSPAATSNLTNFLKECVTWVEQSVDSSKSQLRATKALVNLNPTQRYLEQNRVVNKEGLSVQ